MRRADYFARVRTRALLDGIGWAPILGALVGTVATISFYVIGDMARAIFWLLVLAFSGFWGGVNIQGLWQDHLESERRAPFPGDIVNEQERRAREATANLINAGRYVERFQGRKCVDDADYAEFVRLNAGEAEAQIEAEREQHRLDLMVQANARVAAGSALMSEAARELDLFNKAVHRKDMNESIARSRQAQGLDDLHD